MRKFITIITLTLGFFVGGLSLSAPAQADSGCVTKSEFHNIYWESQPLWVAKRFGTSGTIVQDYTEHKVVTTYDTGMHHRRVIVVRYNKCGHWGKHKYLKITYATWWVPDSWTEYVPAGMSDLEVMTEIRERA